MARFCSLYSSSSGNCTYIGSSHGGILIDIGVSAKRTAEALCEIVKATITAEDFVFDGVTGTMTWDKSGAATKAPIIIELGK